MEEKEKYQKCSVSKGRFVVPCRGLREATELRQPSGKKKGIFAWSYSNQDGPTRKFYGAKSGAYETSGTLFNFCPFCGEKINEPFSE